MFLTGLGIGPAFSVLTIVVQSVVPFDRLGVATGNLTFFRQIGGSVGLAIFSTLFANGFKTQLVPQLIVAGVPQQQATDPAVLAKLAGVTQVGGSVRGGVALIPELQAVADQVVAGIFQAFSLAIANAFWLGVIAGVIALVLVVVGLPEVALRGMGSKANMEPAAGGQRSVPVIAE